MAIRVYQADWLFLGNREFIRNGVVEISPAGEIMHVGKHPSSPEHQIERVQGAISPGFINCHCHLELSHLKGKIEEDQSLPSFIRGVQKYREATAEEVAKAMEVADFEMQKNGIVAVGDICNGSSSFELKKNSPIRYHNFIELFGFDPKQADSIFSRGKELLSLAENQGFSASLVPHSPYSVSAELMKQIAAFEPDKAISIHNQESESENELFEQKSGKIYEMLREFELPMDDFVPSATTALQSYLPQLRRSGNMLLVHNTFTSAEDIAFAGRNVTNLYWCFCPNANWYIERKLPQINHFLTSARPCVLGTDSLASNHELSILSEMLRIQAQIPNIETVDLIEMACRNGAQFLGLQNELGELKIGSKPGLNLIQGIHESGRLMEDASLKVLA